MNIVEAPVLSPGCCAISKSSKGRMIDTGIDFDNLPPFGRMYVAEETVADMAQKFGMARKTIHERALNRVKKLEQEVTDLTLALDAEKSANQALLRAGYDKEPAGVV